MRSSRQLLCCLVLLLLAGCAALEPQLPTSASWQAHSQQLTLLQQWTASGKMAVRSADAAESASLEWRQHDQETRLQLSGPLGVGATTIYSDGRQLDIQQGNEHRTLDISTADAIVQSTGWDLPLLSLTYWLKGLPSPHAKVQKLELDPRTELLQSLQQDDWEVRYEQYGQFEQYMLPTRMSIQRGSTRAKVILSHWQTSPG